MRKFQLDQLRPRQCAKWLLASANLEAEKKKQKYRSDLIMRNIYSNMLSILFRKHVINLYQIQMFLETFVSDINQGQQ